MSHLFSMPKYKNVVSISILAPNNQKSLQNVYNSKHKIESRDWYNYLQKLGVDATWDDVQFLIRRFLYDSKYFRVKNALRWDWKEPHDDSEDTHFESVDHNKARPAGIKVFLLILVSF